MTMVMSTVMERTEGVDMAAGPEDFHTPPGGWTTDDLDELPEDGIRRELIDGVLIVSPSPTNVHQSIAGLLMVALNANCPPEYAVTQGVEIRVSKQRSFIPDVLATTCAAARRQPSHFRPDEVVLAVEIVSPSSRGMDRVAKPGFYAEAGIPFYWRVETKGGLVVHTHRLDRDGSCTATGEFGSLIDTDEPWGITIPVPRITPPWFDPE